MMVTYFGVQIDRLMQEWFKMGFLPELREKYGEDIHIAAIVLDPVPWALSQAVNPDTLKTRHLLISDNGKEVNGDEGLIANVRHKLNFVLRTGLPSSYARQRPDLVEPGDFPWAGAGTYKGYTGGVSGLNDESDWWVFERIVDTLIEFRTAAAKEAIRASKERVEGWRYLENNSKPPVLEKADN